MTNQPGNKQVLSVWIAYSVHRAPHPASVRWSSQSRVCNRPSHGRSPQRRSVVSGTPAAQHVTAIPMVPDSLTARVIYLYRLSEKGVVNDHRRERERERERGGGREGGWREREGKGGRERERDRDRDRDRQTETL